MPINFLRPPGAISRSPNQTPQWHKGLLPWVQPEAEGCRYHNA